MKKILKNRTFIIIILSICLGFYMSYYLFVKKNSSLPGMTKSIENISKKAITSEAIINTLKEKKELIVMEASLDNELMLDDSWGNFEIFKKITYINLTGKGIYSIDLSMIEATNINIKNDSKVIYMKLPKPIIRGITLEEDKTTYKTETGLLRFGELKLTPEENNLLNLKAKDRMMEKLLETSNIFKAEESAKKSLTDIVNSIILDKENYSIIISFY
ncbi:DUF4230 domain-containing protein [Clostridium malenominatum]|uniref:DUF4230 domain-containing protein n=1 Tax=Clostridium malenominatum TaxID=1539 RepID=A0ABN1J8A9_9CLOT